MTPVTTAADATGAVTLYCAVDSNPPATYFWTKGIGREVLEKAIVALASLLRPFIMSLRCRP
jgi:hypothetical protein